MGRYLKGLDALNEVHMLMQYLYLDERHEIVFKNHIGVPFSLKLDDNLNMLVSQLDPVSVKLAEEGVIPAVRQQDLSISQLCSVIQDLKKQPPVSLDKLVPDGEWTEEEIAESQKEMEKRFSNFWEELVSVLETQIGHNAYHQMQMNNKTPHKPVEVEYE